MGKRRVITGDDRDGRAVIVADEVLAPTTIAIAPGAEFYTMWGADSLVALPSDGSQPPMHGWFPPSAGFRFTILTMPPAGAAEPPADMKAAMDEIGAKLPGMIESIDPAHPHLHVTDTIDFIVIVSGCIWLEMDDGKEVELKKGDTVIQNGTRHSWHNRSGESCEMLAAVVGARRR